MKIDAHHHYWDYSRGDYAWIRPDDPILARTFGPSDLEPLLARHGIERTILVQATDTLAETEYLLEIADATARVAGVVGWIDFERRDHLRELERLARHRKFLGVRPMIKDIADVDWMLRSDVQWAYQSLIDLDLSFDALGLPQHLENFHILFSRYPGMRTVIDHCLKPQIRHREFDAWAGGIRRLADDTNAFIKLSGLVTECDDGWDTDDLAPYVNHVIECFGAKRIMWGSDWPVCLLQAGYDQWHSIAVALTDHLSTSEKDSIFGATAAVFYRV